MTEKARRRAFIGGSWHRSEPKVVFWAPALDLTGADGEQLRAFSVGTRGARLNRMNARVDHLLNEVLGLPVEERSALAVALLDSLETADEASISDLWRAEINRRRAELRAGRVQAALWADVRQRLGSL